MTKGYVAIDIGGTSVKWALMDEAGAIAERGQVPTAFTCADELIRALVEVARPFCDRVAGVGVSAPGGIFEDDPDGTIHRGGALLYMDGVPLGRRLREALGVPVVVNNDGKCCALGEYAAGALRGTRCGVVLAIGTGIGGGIVIDGRVLRGAHCFAGEFSFLNNDVSQTPSMERVFAGTSGWRGLRAMVLAEKGLVEQDAPEVDGRVIFEWIAAGDAAARRGLERYCRLFDGWLVNLQAVLDPDVFAIGGGISCHPELIACMDEQMDEVLKGYAGGIAGMPRPRVRAAELGNDANLYGAVYECRRVCEERSRSGAVVAG